MFREDFGWSSFGENGEEKSEHGEERGEKRGEGRWKTEDRRHKAEENETRKKREGRRERSRERREERRENITIPKHPNQCFFLSCCSRLWLGHVLGNLSQTPCADLVQAGGIGKAFSVWGLGDLVQTPCADLAQVGGRGHRQSLLHIWIQGNSFGARPFQSLTHFTRVNHASSRRAVQKSNPKLVISRPEVQTLF